MANSAERVAALCDGVLAELGDGPQRQQVQAIRDRLSQPLNVAVAGRVKAGKSTLVNALVGQKVAPTAVEECTKVVTLFAYGVPERVEIALRGGDLQARPLGDGRIPEPLGPELDEIELVRVYLSRDYLKRITLIDTPGVTSVNQQHSSRTEELLMDRASRGATSHADALVFLLSPGVRREDVDALGSFEALFHGRHASPATAVGVLSRADQIAADGDRDPLAVAAELAERQAAELRSLSSTVIPVAGLIAETAEGQVLTERDARALQILADSDTLERERMLFSHSSFQSYDTAISPEARRRLVRLLDLYGIRRCLEFVDSGASGATDLERRLREISGIGRLRDLLDHAFTHRADALKSNAALAALRRVAWQSGDPANAAVLRDLRDAVEDVRLEPSMRAIGEIWAGQAVANDDVYLPDALRDDLTRLLTGDTLAEKLGFQDDPGEEKLLRSAQGAVARWRSFANGGATSDTEERIARIVYRSFERIATEVPTTPREA